VSGSDSTAGEAEPAAKGAVTIVTQTRVRPENADAFARWQEETSSIVASFPGFIKQTVIRPSPPVQVDWVILQRFASAEAAVAWLNSEQRLNRIEDASRMLVGRDDINIVHDGSSGVLPSPVSAVISTRIKPGQETAYRPGNNGSPLRSRRLRASRAIASSHRCPACRIIGSRSCASTRKRTCRRGSTRPNAIGC
jgi:heme-degrading monooxygenase HmoA